MKVNKVKAKKLLASINKLLEIDTDLYNQHSEDRHFLDSHGSWFLNYYLTLDVVYKLFTNRLHSAIYSSFNTPGSRGNPKPVAWYRTQFCRKGDGSIPGPKGHQAFIPDCIDNLILSDKYSANKKVELLTRMFGDLEKLQKNYKAPKTTEETPNDSPKQQPAF